MWYVYWAGRRPETPSRMAASRCAARELLMRIAQTRDTLIWQILKPSSAERAADGFKGRGPIAVALMAAKAAELSEQALPAGEGRKMTLLLGDGEISGEGFSRRFIEVEARQRAAGRASTPFIPRFYRNIGGDAGTESGMALSTMFLAHESGRCCGLPRTPSRRAT